MKSVLKLTMVSSAAALALAAAHGIASDRMSIKTVELPAAGKSMTVKGRIRGYESIDYAFTADPGRRLQAGLKANNSSCYFNVLQDGKDEALFTGSLSGNQFDARLTEAGPVRVRVYLMRNAARRNAACSYTLTLR